MTAIAVICLPLVAAADDWPQWGGPGRDLDWREEGIVTELPDGQLPRVWSAEIAEGYAGPAVADGRVFVMDRVAAQGRAGTERVHCLDAETGESIWQHKYDALYTISYPAGPRATPTVADRYVYTLGAVGKLCCFMADSGVIVWEKDLQREYNVELPIWGMAAAPLVDGNQLIVLVGGPDALVVSFDRETGAELWRSLDDPQVGYCPPMIYEFGDSRQLIVWHPAAVSSLDPNTGKLLWQQPFEVRAGLTVPTPRTIGNRLFVTSFYNGPLMLDVAGDGSGADVLWRGASDSELRTDKLHGLMSTPMIADGYIYGVGSYGQLRCLDATNGERIWETFEATGEARWWNAFLIPHVSGRTFICNEQGDLIIAELSPQRYHEIDRAKLIEPTRPVRRRMTIWSHPAFAMKSVFARNDREIVRVSLEAAR